MEYFHHHSFLIDLQLWYVYNKKLTFKNTFQIMRKYYTITNQLSKKKKKKIVPILSVSNQIFNLSDYI